MKKTLSVVSAAAIALLATSSFAAVSNNTKVSTQSNLIQLAHYQGKSDKDKKVKKEKKDKKEVKAESSKKVDEDQVAK